MLMNRVRRSAFLVVVGALLASVLTAAAAHPVAAEPNNAKDPVRFATFNASLNRGSEEELIADLSATDDPQAAAVAEII
jgi:hypothetical protein